MRDHPIDRSEKANDADIPAEECARHRQPILGQKQEDQKSDGDAAEQTLVREHEADEPRVLRWSLIQVTLLLFAIATMAVARYLR